LVQLTVSDDQEAIVSVVGADDVYAFIVRLAESWTVC
jgi:hypothetical protein